MLACPVGHDNIGRFVVIELVDFISTGEDRNVPAKQINKDSLAFLKHRAKQAVTQCLFNTITNNNHNAPPRERPSIEQFVMSRVIPRTGEISAGECQ